LMPRVPVRPSRATIPRTVEAFNELFIRLHGRPVLGLEDTNA
jgi:hypothetical protein